MMTFSAVSFVEEESNGDSALGSDKCVMRAGFTGGDTADVSIEEREKEVGIISNRGLTSGIETVDEGQWVDGKLYGYCRRTYADGCVLDGEFRNGVIYRGSGVWRHADGAVVEGQWVEGLLVGRCKVSRPDGRVQEGEFVKGVIRNGSCVLHRNGVAKTEAVWEEGVLTIVGQKTPSIPEGLRHRERASDTLDAPLDPRGTLFDPRNVLGLREVWSSQLCVGCATADNALPVVYVQHMSKNEDQLPVTGRLHLGVIGESPVRRQPSTLSSLVRLPVCCCAGFLQERVAPPRATPRPDLDQLAYIVSHSNVVSATYR
jgi:hypothetical protein